MKVCEKCQMEYPDDLAFCSYCGLPLRLKEPEFLCPSCGIVLGKDMPNFCPNCGRPVATSETNNRGTNSPGTLDINNMFNKAKSTLKNLLKDKDLKVVFAYVYGYFVLTHNIAPKIVVFIYGLFGLYLGLGDQYKNYKKNKENNKAEEEEGVL